VQQAFRCILVTPTLKDFIQNDAVLINSSPKPEFLPLDRHDDFIQMPNIAGSRLQSAQTACNSRAKLFDPSADSFVRDINPAFQQHLFNLPEAEIEPAIEPD